MENLPSAMMWLVPAIGMCATSLFAQTFTKIVDPANPVVTDQYESGGGCWGDVNNDGFLDLFVAHGNLAAQQNTLYLNNRNGSFIKVTTGAVVTDGGSSIGGTWGDFNNDGKLDLFVTNRQPSSGPPLGNFLYRGNGDTVFARVIGGSPDTDRANSNSSSWVDVNGDGYLDLFVVNFQSNNFLYYNSGPPDYTFTRADTGAIVLDGNNFSIPGAWADYNNDRRPDLFIGNAGTQNDVLFTNEGNGRFTRTVIPDSRSTLGASWGDYNNDGYLDLFVTNYLNQNNILYRNSGPPDSQLVPVDTGIVSNDGGNSVGSVWGDFDNDGDLDLFVANDGGVCFLYLNNGPPAYGFTKVTTGEIVNTVANSFGCAAADYDNDGALDLFVANRLNQRNFLYRNDGNSNHWVTVRFVGVTSNRAGIGTKVRILATIGGAPRWQMQEVAAQTGYNSQNLLLHFGLGTATVIDSMKVEWPSGQTDSFADLAPDRTITMTEGIGPTSVAGSPLGMPVTMELQQNYPNPFNPTTAIKYSLPSHGSNNAKGRGGEGSFVSLRVFDLLGREVATLVDGEMEPGNHQVTFDGSRLSSGLYFYRLTAGQVTFTKKMIVLK